MKTPDPGKYVTKVDPALSRQDGPLQVLVSSKPASKPEGKSS